MLALHVVRLAFLLQPSQISESLLKTLTPPPFIPHDPPNIFAHIEATIRREPCLPAYPHLAHVNPTSRDIVQLATLIVHGADDATARLAGCVKTIVLPGSRVEAAEGAAAGRSATYPMPERAVLFMTEMSKWIFLLLVG